MIFTSFDFLLFLPIVFAIYWMLPKNGGSRNKLILVASYFFYGYWDWRFLGLILFSTVVDFIIAKKIQSTTKKKSKRLLYISLFVNVGLLGVFKYFNFFLDNFVEVFTFLGEPIDINRIDIILPVGISFYTFQTLSYTIDVYKRTLKPSDNFIEFAAYVSFFPQLVAGPIERASNLLPQFKKEKKFDYHQGVLGLKQILWGVIKKVVIADNCAVIVNELFQNQIDHNGITLFIGAALFAFQIYGDFSGYSDIAIGTSRLFGFNLMQNFNFPYFSRDIAEFWRKWHISLTTWFRDYIYIPLGGSKVSLLKKIRNIFIIFLISGFWHGANWTFIIWGAINALYFLPLLILGKNRKNLNNTRLLIPSVLDLLKMSFTFFLVTVSWVFFRADDITIATDILQKFFLDLFSKKSFVETYNLFYWDFNFTTFILILVFIVIEWIGKNDQFAIEKIGENWRRLPKFIFLTFIFILIVNFMATEKSPFIYFDF
jgi:alginate O-acetyltransferase complex protein AlgI